MTPADTVGCVVSTRRAKGMGQNGAWRPRTLRLVLALCVPMVFSPAAEAAASASKTRELCATHTAVTPAFRKAARRLGWRVVRESELKALQAVVADGSMVTTPQYPKRKIRWKAQAPKALQTAAAVALRAGEQKERSFVMVTGKKPLSVLVAFSRNDTKPAFLQCLFTGQLDKTFHEFITAVSSMNPRSKRQRSWPYQLVKSNAKNVNPKRPAVVDLQAARYLKGIEAELGRKPWAQGGFSQVSYAHE